MVEIDKRLYQEIKDYCKLNNLVIKDFINKLLRKSFTIEKYGDKPFAENKPETGVVYCPYVIDDTLQVVLDPKFINGELSEKIKERYSKPISDKFYDNFQVDGLMTEIEPNGKIGKMELPDEPPYNNVMVTTEPIKDSEEQAIEKIKDLIESQVSVPADIMEAVDEHFFELLGDNETTKAEEPKVVKKSRKRKLN